MPRMTRIPTHSCIHCGALWIRVQSDLTAWNLFSRRCGPCCDNSPMGDQIKALPLTRGGTTANLDQAVADTMQFFTFAHLPPHLSDTSLAFAELAWRVANGPQNSETLWALRGLLTAKDCAVRSLLFND